MNTDSKLVDESTPVTKAILVEVINDALKKSMQHSDKLFAESKRHTNEMFEKSAKHADNILNTSIKHTDDSIENLAGMIARRFDEVDKNIENLEHETNRRFTAVQAQLDNIYLNNLTRREYDFLKKRVDRIEHKLKIA